MFSCRTNIFYNKILDKSSADYKIPVVTTHIPLTPCPAYATTTFTETEVIPIVTMDTSSLCYYSYTDTQ